MDTNKYIIGKLTTGAIYLNGLKPIGPNTWVLLIFHSVDIGFHNPDICCYLVASYKNSTFPDLSEMHEYEYAIVKEMDHIIFSPCIIFNMEEFSKDAAMCKFKDNILNDSNRRNIIYDDMR